MTEADLQQRFTELFAVCEQPLYRFVFSLLGNAADTDDVLQETLRQLWEHFDAYDTDRPFLPWATQFAYRQVLMHRRRSQAHRRHFSPAVVELLAAERPGQVERTAEQRRALTACLGRLNDDDRALVRHRYEADATLEAIASQSGRSANSLYKRLQRIRAMLLECVRGRMERRGYDA